MSQAGSKRRRKMSLLALKTKTCDKSNRSYLDTLYEPGRDAWMEYRKMHAHALHTREALLVVSGKPTYKASALRIRDIPTQFCKRKRHILSYPCESKSVPQLATIYRVHSTESRNPVICSVAERPPPTQSTIPWNKTAMSHKCTVDL